VRYVVTPLVGVRGWGIYGLMRVMLTIDGDNPASERVIERNGGKLDWQHIEPETGRCFLATGLSCESNNPCSLSIESIY
jgi:hypothetical protein